MAKAAVSTIFCGFGSLMDIDKLIHRRCMRRCRACFGSLMDIDKLIHISIVAILPSVLVL